MNPFDRIFIRDADGERTYEREALPLEIGSGPESEIRLAGLRSGAPLAYVGIEADNLYIQPASDAIPVFQNERLVTQSTWIQDSDVLRIENVRIHCEITDQRVALRTELAEPDRSEERPRVVPPSRAPDTIEPIAYTPRKATTPPASRSVRRFKVVAWSSFFVLALFTAFLFTARSVRIDVTPPPDEFDLNGFPTVLIGERHLMRPGSYVLSAKREGYAAIEAEIEVGSEQNQEFAFEMERLPGQLVIDTGAVKGAPVLIDANEVGTTPAKVELPEGSHKVAIAAPRYLRYEEEIAIEGGGVVQRLDIELVPAWAEMRIESSPAGAMLSVDGDDRGTTPLTAEVLEGTRELALHLPGYKIWRQELGVEANRPQVIDDIVLLLADATLSLKTSPAGALVLVDGFYRGQTPIALEQAPGEEHVVSVSRLGSVPKTRRLEMSSGQREEWQLSLPNRVGEVLVQTRPADAEIFVDGRPRTLKNGRIALSARPHVVEARKTGFDSSRETVRPLPGFPIEIALALQRADEEPAVAKEKEVSAPEPLMVLIQPGLFTMGASRREPGRRANETLRKVQFSRPFYFSRNEVTNSDFARFDPQHDSGSVGRMPLAEPNQPVVNVSWDQAAAYCNWLSDRENLPRVYEKMENGRYEATAPIQNGYRLPTEAEWEWVARAAGRAKAVRFAWGMSLPPEKGSGNYADVTSRGVASEPLPLYNDGHAVTAPVGNFPANPLGIHDLGGNAAEWTHDIYAIGGPVGVSVAVDPTGASSGRHHVIRGSSWRDSSMTRLRLSFRDYGDQVRPDLGFRVARYAD